MDFSKPIQLFGLDQEGKSATVTAQRHLNLYAEIKQEAEKSRVVFYGTPGTTLFSSANGDTPVRGWIAVGSLLYYVHRGTFYEINNAGTRTSRGTLNTTTGFVDMAYNGTVILLVDGTNAYTYTIATTTLAEVSDADFPDGANTCGWLDGQFIVDAGDGEDSFYISANGTDWDALDFATAESAPDGLIRVFVDHGQILLFGERTIEPWGNVGGADFPFAPIKGAIAQFGLAARRSLTFYNDTLAFLAKNSMGQVQVMAMVGNTPQVISSPELDHIINNYSAVSDATAFGYLLGGHPMLQVNFPTANASWLYDASTGLWSPLEYGLDGDRHRGEMYVNFLTRSLISDYEDGNIYQLDPDTYTDNGTAIARELIGRHVFNSDNRVIVDELYVDMEVGVGLESGQGSDPQAMLSVSKNNGKTWGAGLWKTIGALGNYTARVVWRRLGLARDWTFKLRVTDPIKVVFTYAAMKAR
jgi:hypothetical protein